MQEETVGMNRTITYIHEYRGSAELVTGRGIESHLQNWLRTYDKSRELKLGSETQIPRYTCG